MRRRLLALGVVGWTIAYSWRPDRAALAFAESRSWAVADRHGCSGGAALCRNAIGDGVDAAMLSGCNGGRRRNDDPGVQLASSLLHATPAWLAFCVAAVLALVAAPRVARADSTGNVDIYFGQGCFWHVQHEFVNKEMFALGRSDKEVTAIAGYAGGTAVGPRGEVCYHNQYGAPDYGTLGHAEVVGLSIPADKVREFAKEYFDAAVRYPDGRADPQDKGPEYRSAIGLPGGIDSPLFSQVQSANRGRLELSRGLGDDADTLSTRRVWVYDSEKFPFHRGELYHQFHDDMREKYSQRYHQLKDVLVQDSKLEESACPELPFKKQRRQSS